MVELSHRTVANRPARPSWAASEKQILAALLSDDKQATRRFTIATMYWRQNMSAKDIATSLDTTVKAVESVLYRLSKKLSPR